MKKVGLALSLFALTACTTESDKFCKCLEAGEELNNYTQQFFTKDPTPEEQEKLTALKEEKKTACSNYETMGGDEMRRLQEACEGN